MKQIFARPDRCMGCRSCEVGCAVQHSKSKSFIAALFEEPRSKKRLYVEEAAGKKVPVMCRHCEDAPCMSACVSGCLYKDENGFVRRHKERCIGCWSCIMACPFGVVSQDTVKKIAVKCDRCHKLDTPACVASCPTRALVLVEADELSREKRHRVALAETES